MYLHIFTHTHTRTYPHTHIHAHAYIHIHVFITLVKIHTNRCARFFAAEVVTALRFIHGKGVMHRDLKPENILLNSKGHLKITDFGIVIYL